MINDINDVQRLKLFVLAAHSHNGLDWTHSLLDAHNEILIMPAYSFFRTLDKFNINALNQKIEKTAKDLVDVFIYGQGYQIQRRRFIFSKYQEKQFRETLLFFLKKTKEKNIYKKLFYGIHYAFSEIHKIKLKKKKILIAHEHVTWHCEKYHQLFDPKFIFVIRDLRASFAGGMQSFKNASPNRKMNALQFDRMLANFFSGKKFMRKISKIKNKKKIYFVINEKMNFNLNLNTKNLSKWLGIKFNKSLLKKTIMGKKWLGESAYLSKGKKTSDLSRPEPKDYYQINNVRDRWKKNLSLKEKNIFEALFYNDLKFFNYKILYNKNIFQRLKNYCSVLFYCLGQDKYYLSKYLILLRNLVRRVVLFINPKFTIKFFKNIN